MVPVNEPWLGQKEQDLVLEAVRTGWISSAGKFVTDFESRWASICERRHGISVCNGTAALETAVFALKLPEGSEVLLPTFTIISCVTAILNNGLVPVFIDADPETWGMDATRVEERINDKTRAIMVVHTYGHPVDMDPILKLADSHGLKVIEDAAEAHGARYKGRICGSFGDVSIFSFYANKIITTGEGGMVLCDDDTIRDNCALYRNLGFRPQRRFRHDLLAHNYRFSNLGAAIGVAQIDRFEEALERKRWMGALYTELLRDVPDLQTPPVKDWGDNVYWVYGIVLGNSYRCDGAELGRCLAEAKIGTRPFFLGMHEQPILQEMGYGIGESYPVAERLARRGLYLPSGLAIRESQIREVIDILLPMLTEYSGSAT